MDKNDHDQMNGVSLKLLDELEMPHSERTMRKRAEHPMSAATRGQCSFACPSDGSWGQPFQGPKNMGLS